MVIERLRRILRHIACGPWVVKKRFPAEAMSRIEKLISESEKKHSGELRFAVEAALDFFSVIRGRSARARALELFSRLRVWDTEKNNGVLIYILLADRDIEIVCDRGINALVPGETWENICREMEEKFREQKFEQGISAGIERISDVLVQHFPAKGPQADELPDKPLVV